MTINQRGVYVRVQGLWQKLPVKNQVKYQLSSFIPPPDFLQTPQTRQHQEHQQSRPAPSGGTLTPEDITSPTGHNRDTQHPQVTELRRGHQGAASPAPGSQPLVPSPWSQVPSWSPALGPQRLIPSPWSPAPGPQLSAGLGWTSSSRQSH